MYIVHYANAIGTITYASCIIHLNLAYVIKEVS